MVSFKFFTLFLKIDIKYFKELIDGTIKQMSSAYAKILEGKHPSTQPDLVSNIFSITE